MAAFGSLVGVHRSHLFVLVSFGLVGSACAEPFDETRQELRSFRIAAAGVRDGVARAAVWSGEGLYHSEAPELAWTLNGQSIGSGFDVVVPGVGTLGLLATSPEGDVREAQVTVAEPPGGLLELSRAGVDLSGTLGLEARRATPSEAIDTTVPLDRATRLSVIGRSRDERLRWMLGGGEGTLLELDEDRADLLPEQITFEDGVATERDPLTAGLLHTLVLGLDDQGANRWLWVDGAFGIEEPLLRHEGRLVPVEGTVAPGLVAVTLASSDALGAISFADATPVDDLTEQDDLSCMVPLTPFRLVWLAEGRCPLADVLGARVVVEAW